MIRVLQEGAMRPLFFVLLARASGAP
ncbi:hypothetical protein ACCAA_180069 [Candidatus Accumulibacter aalborgensis]|uniref:Uncharacterized protein n=1 Tax=Candidatus Accumulibacter aalborgensis TaxID=1860102 RepID=A0A1A8XHY7_9PROT|nr:hypothetical protein ACCAA_180069 [Candidatus Accumulibacter aalborgensis]